MLEKAERGGAAIVVIGDFAPRIFHPSWFREFGLLGKHEVEATLAGDKLVISDHFAQFQIGGFGILVDSERLQVTTEGEDLFEAMRDLVQGTLAVLDYPTIRSIGINWYAHFRCDSEDSWHAAGDKLAPKDLWKQLDMGRPGTMDVSIRLERNDEQKGHITVSVQPSAPVKFGLYMAVNDHFELGKDPAVRARDVSALLRDNWPKSGLRVESIFGLLYRELVTNAQS